MKGLFYALVVLMMGISAGLCGQTCTPLTFDCPDDVTFTADPGDCSVSHNYSINILGDCPLVSSVQIDGSGLTSGDFFPIGVTTQTYVLEDSTGHQDTCTFDITVVEFPDFITDDVCNSHVFIGVDNDCEVLITPDMILEGGQYGCYDSFQVVIQTMTGGTVANPITSAFVNQQLMVTIIDRAGNSCWGYLTVEDKFIPELSCGVFTVDCGVELLPSVDSGRLPFPLPIGADVQPTSGVGPFTVNDFDGCGSATLTFVDHVNELDCQVAPFTRTIDRIWQIVDVHGNISTCTDVIQIRTTPASELIFPDQTVLCSGNWDANGDGIPQPEEIGDIALMECDVWAEYSDLIKAEGCGTIIFRDWSITQMCTGDVLEYKQTIEIEDDVPPVIQCAPFLEGTTNDENCTSNYHVPAPPVLTDECSADVTYSVSSPAGLVVNNGTAEHPYYVIQGLIEGSYTLTYTAEDACGLTSTCTTTLTIEDQTPPTIVCDPTVVVYLLKGEHSVHVDRLYTLARDECGVDSLRLRRTERGPCGESSYDDLFWKEEQTFCCEDIGSSVIIEVGVWDVHGNFSSCLTFVHVTGELPEAKCPPDVKISCGYPLDLDDLSEFGMVRTHADDVMDIRIDDIDYIEGCKMQHYTGPKLWGQDPLLETDCDVQIQDSIVDLRVCGRSGFEDGEMLPGIRRYFIYTLNGERIGICHQDIFILDCGGDASIAWPRDTFTFYCAPAIDSMFGGRPTNSGSGCGAFTFTFSDSSLGGSGDTCSQILRIWTATDTCSPDTMVQLTHVQRFFVLYDNQLDILCVDTILVDPNEPCDQGSSGCSRVINVDAPDVMSCDTTMAFRYEIDVNADPNANFMLDLEGFGDEISTEIESGWHLIRWMVQDGCGGRDTCITAINVPPCDPPEILCEDVMVIVTDTNGIYVSVAESIDSILNDCGGGVTGYVICDSFDFAGLDSVRIISESGTYVSVAEALEALAMSDTCFLADSLLIDCDDLTGITSTLFYEVLFIQGMNVSSCEARIVVEDTALICDPEPCELVYGITSGGQLFSINTNTGGVDFVVNTGVTTGTNACAVNADLGLAYYASERTVYWADLITGDVGTVGVLPMITGDLTNAGGAYWRGHYYCGPENDAGNQVVDLFRVELSGDGKSFVSPEVNLTNGAVPTGNFGDFIVLDGMIGSETMILSLFNNTTQNGIWEYDVLNNDFSLLFGINSFTSSQITIDNLGRVWYFDNANDNLGILDFQAQEVIPSTITNVGFTFADLGRAFCPPVGSAIFSSTQDPTVAAIRENEMTAIPNPFDEVTSLHIHWPEAEEATLMLVTVDGRVLSTQTVQLQSGTQQLPVSVEARGMVLAKLISKSGFATCKLISE